jgi:5-methylcytosine-specific restriction enzyme A
MTPGRSLFDPLVIGSTYSRPQLARLWGYESYEALSRGVVTPKGTPYIILFITRDKQSFLHQYQDVLLGSTLMIEGERNHASDRRLVAAQARGDEVHLFYRERHHTDFVYKGPVHLVSHELRKEGPSHFEFILGPAGLAAAVRDLETDDRTHGGELGSFTPDEEGQREIRQHVTYERSNRNRAHARELHGSRCLACGFDFNRVYGHQHADSFIQMHHVKSVARGIATPDLATDLVPLCSNCHSMAHRRRGMSLNVEELKALIDTAKAGASSRS